MERVITFIDGRTNDSFRPLKFWAPAFAAISLFVSGCGKTSSRDAYLEGNVTSNGKQLPDDAKASVVFVSDGQEANSVSVPVTNGRYDSPLTPMGAVNVFFEINRPVGPAKTSERTGKPYQDVARIVPAKFATGLPLDVKGDDPNRGFQLTD